MPLAAADGVTLLDPTLPVNLAATSAVWTGEHALVFGGWDGSAAVDTILRFDPGTGELVAMGAALPTPRYGTAAAWDGVRAYVIGGNTVDALATDEILAYDPATDTLATLSARLPAPVQLAAVVWTGSHVLVFGGDGTEGAAGAITRFTPATGAVDVMGATLPESSRLFTSAAWDGTHAYLFGGATRDPATGEIIATDAILRYDPATDTLATMGAKLPAARAGTTSVFDGRYVFVFGATSTMKDIVRYDPTTDAIEIIADAFPRPRVGASAVWDGGNVLLFGAGCRPACTEVYAYYPFDAPDTPVPELPALALSLAGVALLAFAGHARMRRGNGGRRE